MSNNKCQFCDNEYSNSKSLKTHQKTAKFCIEIQKGLKNQPNVQPLEIRTFRCDYCEDEFNTKYNLERHFQTCKYKEIRQKEDENNNLKNVIEKKDEKLNNIKEQIDKLKEEINIYKTELRVKDELLKIKDDIIFKLEKENESLKNKVDDTYMSLLDRSDKTYNTFFEKEEKLIDTLINQNSSSKNSKSINNNLTINNYGIKPITTESVINALESYNSKQKDAFNGYQYDILDLELDSGSLKVEYVFYGIIRELKDYYGITDISREKIIFNNNGELTLTTIQEFIRTNVVMNNVDSILEWIFNLLTQVQNRILQGEIEVSGVGGIREMREMTNQEKIKLRDTGKTLEYIYGLFKTSKEKGSVNIYMTKWLSDGAMKSGKVIGKISKKNLELKE